MLTFGETFAQVGQLVAEYVPRRGAGDLDFAGFVENAFLGRLSVLGGRSSVIDLSSMLSISWWIDVICTLIACLLLLA